MKSTIACQLSSRPNVSWYYSSRYCACYRPIRVCENTSCLSVCLAVCLSVRLSVCLPVLLYLAVSICVLSARRHLVRSVLRYLQLLNSRSPGIISPIMHCFVVPLPVPSSKYFFSYFLWYVCLLRTSASCRIRYQPRLYRPTVFKSVFNDLSIIWLNLCSQQQQ